MTQPYQWYKDEKTGQYVFDVSVWVNAPVETCFNLWSHFADFPRIMRHITLVKKTGETSWHWEAMVAERRAEWEADTTEFRKNEVIAWHATSGVRNSGSVRFTPEDTGCRILVHLAYDPPYGPIGDYVAEHRLNDEFVRDLQQDLENFKQAVESGELQQFRPAA